MNTLRNLGMPAPIYDDTATMAERQRLQQQKLQNRGAAGSGMPVYDAPNLDRNTMSPDELSSYNWLKSQGVPYELASLGQRYQNMPPATFDQRFGPYQAPGPTDEARDQLRRMLEQQMLPPEAITPGQQLVDPNQRGAGERHPSGYYLLRGI